MNHRKQKVFIVVEFPVSSDELKILKVFSSEIGALKFIQRMKNVNRTYHILKKSVEGTTLADIKVNKVLSPISLIHEGIKHGRR